MRQGEWCDRSAFCNGLPRDVVESPPLGVFKEKAGCGAYGHGLLGDGGGRGTAQPDDLGGLLQP